MRSFVYSMTPGSERLATMIDQKLGMIDRPVMGLMLCAGAGDEALRASVSRCQTQNPSGPLSDVMRQSKALFDMAEKNASRLSRRWGRWTESFEPKYSALRPLEWILEHNPQLRARA